MAEVASAFVSVMPSAKGFGSKLDSEVSGDIESSGKKAGSRWGSVFKVGALAVLGGAALVGKFLGDSIAEAREAQKVGALTESTIKATGKAAGVTAKQVGDLAGAISQKTGIDDETIQSGQNMLLTFKNIRNEAGEGNDIFNQTTQTLVDLSAAMGTEPKQAAIQLGKALNDPVKGISALSRVGVTFTEGQKKVIEGLVEGGETAKAQKIILKELNSEFGGAAEAQATTGEKMEVAWGNLKEAVGNAILPIIDSLLPKLTNAINWISDNVVPKIQEWWDDLAPAREAIGKFGDGVETMIGLVRNGDWKGAWDKAKNAASSAVTTQASTVKKFATSRLIPAINRALGWVRAAWAKKWESFWKDPDKAYDKTINSTKTFGTRLTDAARGSAQNAAFAFIKAFNATPRGAARIGTQTLNSWRQAMTGMPRLSTRIAVDVAGAFLKGVSSMPGAAHRIAIDVGLGLIGGLRNAIDGAVAIGAAIINGLIGGIRGAASGVATEAARVVTNAIQAAKDAAHIKSPSRKMHEVGQQMVEGLALGLEGGHGRVGSAMDRLSAGIVVRPPGAIGVAGAVGGGGRATFTLVDRDGVLIGTMEGVADDRIHGHRDLEGQMARAM